MFTGYRAAAAHRRTWARSQRRRSAAHLAVLGEALLLEIEDVLEGDDVDLHPRDLGDVRERRLPSEKRVCWTIRCTALAICSRIAFTGRSMPAISTIVSIRPARRGSVGVEGGQRAVVAGVHRLQHVERLAGPALSDHDPVGPHSQAVLHQVANGDRALPSRLGGRDSS